MAGQTYVGGAHSATVKIECTSTWVHAKCMEAFAAYIMHGKGNITSILCRILNELVTSWCPVPVNKHANKQRRQHTSAHQSLDHNHISLAKLWVLPPQVGS